MNNLLEYNGYTAMVEYSSEDHVFFGKISHINDLVTFEGESVKELEEAFQKSVDDYVETCKKPITRFRDEATHIYESLWLSKDIEYVVLKGVLLIERLTSGRLKTQF